MKIVQLTAENVKRLKAVEITPDGTVQVIGGRNAQGKSSVLDAIWLALGGGPAAKDTARPIRDGETKASVTLDLGELKVAAHLAPIGEAYDTTITGQTFRVTDIAYEAMSYHDGVQTACFAIGITHAGEYKTTEIDLTDPPAWCPPTPVWFAEIASDMEQQVKQNA